MTVTLDDLKIEPDLSRAGLKTTWERVTAPGNRYFLIGNCDHTALQKYVDEHYIGLNDFNDKVVESVESGSITIMDIFYGGGNGGLLPNGYELADAGALLSGLPVKETWVMEATEDWDVMNECGPDCAAGVCKKRLASREDEASQELGYNMLLDYLNA